MKEIPQYRRVLKRYDNRGWVPPCVHHQQHVFEALRKSIRENVSAGRSTELSNKVQNSKPECSEGWHGSEGGEMLKENLAEHHARSQLCLVPALPVYLTMLTHFKQPPQHREEDAEECELPLKRGENLKIG